MLDWLRRLPPNVQGALWLVSGGFIFTATSVMIRLLSSQIESVLLKFEGLEPHYQILVDRGTSQTDDLEIRVEIPESIRQDPAKIAQFESRLSYEISGTLGIRVRLELLPPKSLPGARANPNASSTNGSRTLELNSMR